MKATKQELLAEIDELRLRLQEAEETLEALRSGAVDALVVSSPEGEQVYTLQGADQTYRHLVENINEGAATLTMAGDILYANRRLADFLGLPLERLIGSTLREHIHEDDLIYFDALLATAQKGESKGEVLLRKDHEDPVSAYLSFKVLSLDQAPKVISLLVTDLTEQKRQEAIIADGKLIQELLQQAELAIVVCDRSGRIIRASQGVHELCGQNPLLLPFHLVFPLKLSSGKTFLTAELFQGQSLRNVEANFRRPDGRTIDVVLNAGPLRSKGSQIIGFVASLTDISERRQVEAEREKLLERLRVSEEELQASNEELQVHMEELQVQTEEIQNTYHELSRANQALKESQGDLRRAQKLSQMGSWRLDLQKNVLFWCDETRRIFGVSDETPLTYETFLAAVHPEDREYVRRKWQAALKGAPYDTEHRILVDGAIKWVRELAELEFDSQGHLLGGFGTTQDITERKQAEAALQRSEQRLRLAQEVGRSGTFDWDLEKKIFTTDNLPALYGFKNEKFKSGKIDDPYKVWMACIVPEDREATQADFRRALETGEYSSEFRIHRQDTGELRWMEGRGQVFFDPDGKPVRMIGINMDITERKQAEEELRLSHQRLDLLAETASRLLASSDPQEVVESICLKVMEFLDCDVCFNYLREEAADRLHLNAWAGIPDQEAKRIEWLDYGVAVCGCTAQNGCRIVAEDIANNDDPRTELVKSYGIQAYACHPLLSGDRLLGTLSYGTRKKKHFHEDELTLMQAVADQVAVAMERQQFEKDLFDSRERERARAEESQALLDSVPIPIFMSRDPSGDSITGNPAAYKLLQMPLGTNLSKSGQNPEPPQFKAVQEGRELSVAELPMQRALTGEWVRAMEFDLVLPDGSSRHVITNAVPLLDDLGQPRGAVGALMDLTELKQAQEALRRAHDELEERVRERTDILRITVSQLQEEVHERRRAEAELTRQSELVQDLYNRAPCGYHSLDPDGWIVRINDTELDWLGYSREELVGRVHFEDLLAEESREAFRRNFKEFLTTGTVRDVEYTLKRKDGTVFPVLLNATAVTDKAGNYLMCRSTVYDITDRKRAEQNLRESEERLRFLATQLLTAQEKERKRLAGELHDELGHALLTLKLSLSSIGRQLLPEQESVQHLLGEQLEYINHVIEEVRRLYHDLSPGDLEDLGLTRALENLIEDFSDHQPDIFWQVDLPDMTGFFSLPAQTIIYRVVQEALTNIGKHAEPTRVGIRAVDENQHVRLTIEDDGRGFDVNEVDQDPDRGVGLAAMGERLYIVGGSVEIWSQKGVGTKLTFKIPKTKE